VRIRKQLLGLAESPLRRWHEEVQSIAQLVADNYEDSELQTSFLNLVPLLIIEQPLKTPFVAAVVLVINSIKPEVLATLLARIASATEEKIQVGEWRDVKLYLKFLACLQSALDGDGLFPLLEELFSRAVDLQTASSDDVRCTSRHPFPIMRCAHKIHRLSARSSLRSSFSPSPTLWPRLPRPGGSRRLPISWIRPKSLPPNLMPYKFS
jgi:hypothetical protein